MHACAIHPSAHKPDRTLRRTPGRAARTYAGRMALTRFSFRLVPRAGRAVVKKDSEKKTHQHAHGLLPFRVSRTFKPTQNTALQEGPEWALDVEDAHVREDLPSLSLPKPERATVRTKVVGTGDLTH